MVFITRVYPPCRSRYRGPISSNIFFTSEAEKYRSSSRRTCKLSSFAFVTKCSIKGAISLALASVRCIFSFCASARIREISKALRTLFFLESILPAFRFFIQTMPYSWSPSSLLPALLPLLSSQFSLDFFRPHLFLPRPPLPFSPASRIQGGPPQFLSRHSSLLQIVSVAHQWPDKTLLPELWYRRSRFPK